MNKVSEQRQKDQKQKIEDLRNFIQKAKDRANEIATILENEKLPDSESLNKLVEIIRDAEKLESDILSGWKENKSIQKGTISDYINYFNEVSKEKQRDTWIEALDKFTRIYSDEAAYDELINNYRNDASNKIEEIKLIKDADKLEEIKEQIDIYLIFVKIIEDGADDSLLDIISEKINPTKIYRGLHTKKYQIRKTDTNNKKTTLNGIIILNDKNLKFDPKNFEKHLDTIPARPALIISCATWLIFFTAGEMIKLLEYFPEKKQSPDDTVKASIEALAAKGYFISFKLSDQDSTRYALASSLKNALATETNWNILKKSREHVIHAMKAYTANFSSLTKAEVISVEERNKAFLDAIDFIGKNLNKETADRKIIEPLECNRYCYFTGQGGVVLLSKKMLESLGENTGDASLSSFLQKNKELVLLLTDINSSEEAKFLVESCLPGRKYQILQQFCSKTEEPVQNVKETELPSDKEDLQTPEAIAKIIADIDIQKDEERFFKLCDILITMLLNKQFPKDDNEPDSIIQALVFLYAMASSKHINKEKREEYKRKSTRFQLATGLILDDIYFNSDTLGQAFPVNEATPEKISAFMRAMFSPDGKWDYDLYGFGDLLAEQLADYSPSLKKIFKDLISLKGIAERGFSSAVLSCFADQTTMQMRDKKIARKATDLKRGPNITVSFDGIKEFVDLCSGQESELYQIMKSIEENDVSNLKLAKDKVKELEDSKGIDNYIDRIWNQVKSINKKTKFPTLEDPARRQAVNWLKKQKSLIIEWLESSGKEKVDISQEIKKLRDDLLSESALAIDSVGDKQDKYKKSPLVYNTLRYIHDALNFGRTAEQTWAFSEFLYSSEVELDDDNKPVFPEFFESLPGMEAWRAVSRHISERKPKLTEVLELINSREEIYYFDNFNHGKKIEEYLILNKQIDPEKRIRWDINEKKARENSIAQEEKLCAEIELAYFYYRINEEEKESLLMLENQFKQYFHKCHNFGHFHFILSMFRKQLENYKNVSGDRLEKQFNNILARPEIDKEWPLVQGIKNLLQNAKFNVAEEYINRLDSGEQELPPEQGYDEKDFFDDFINSSETLSTLCVQNRNRAIRMWHNENLILDPTWAPVQKDNSRLLLDNWPAGKDDTTEDNIKVLFNEIGFEVEKVILKTKKQYLVFELQVRPPNHNLSYYEHPIAAFGTRINQPVNIICLYEVYTVADLMNNILKLQLGNDSIVLYDRPFSLADRRKLIEDFHNTNGQNSFILIDQILGLYLARLTRSERIPAMLKITLPFSYCQPFNDDSGTVPDEMFFGRKIELNDITDLKGTNFVYGGRQLGKTALLGRARSIAHKPDYGEYAVYVPKKEPDETVADVYTRMQEVKVPVTMPGDGNWKHLCHWIKVSFDKGKIKKLLFLIDEADDFLEFDKKNNFSIIRELINLSILTENRFKFVFAGLHNVARSRTAMEKNGVFPQMPKPLCISPLKPTDAYYLLMRPLLYLGFKREHLDLGQIEPILVNTIYYPGIIHSFGHTLIKTVLFGHYKNYFNANTHPPYELTDKQLRQIFPQSNFNDLIKEKVNITLNLDTRYKILANIIAYQYYIDKGNETDRSKGYSVEDIYKLGNDLNIVPKENFSLENVANLLSEMAEMGILWKNKDKNLFRLRLSRFLGIIGTMDEVEKNLIDLGTHGFYP